MADSRFESAKVYTGTSAERIALLETNLRVDDEFQESDTGDRYSWIGTRWQIVSLSGSTETTISINQTSAASDAFGRLRTSNPFAVFDNKNIASRNRNQWEEPITGVVMTYNTLAGGTFTTGEIRGLLPLGLFAIGTVVTDNGSNSMTIDCNHNDFQVGDTITQGGVTAVLVATDLGSDIQHDYNTGSVTLTVGTGSGDKAIRQTHRYSAYVPGKSQHISDTFIMGAAIANVRRRVGYFDANNGEGNGLFIEQNGTTDIAFVSRTDTSGSAVDNRYLQADWNLDTLDGSNDKNNPSGIELDLSKSQLFLVDFLWQGVGSVRYGFKIDGILIYCHTVHHANSISVPFMRTPTLPVRYEIENLAATGSASTMSEICSSVVSEGGYQLPGYEFSQSRGVVNKAVTVRAPIFAIRLKNSFDGNPNRRTARFLNAGVVTSTNDAHFEIAHIHEAVDITANWIDVGGGSAIEYSTDISAVTGRPEHIIENVDATTAAGNKAQASVVSGEFINAHGFISQNFDSTNSQLFVIYATSVTGTADVRGHLTWIEFD